MNQLKHTALIRPNGLICYYNWPNLLTCWMT